MTLTLYDEFAGCGGSSQGAASVPGVELILAANHDEWAIKSHSENFPRADHYLGDVRSIDLAKFPRADIFWASPSCPPFSSARGVRRDFDRDTQGVLFETEADAKITDAKRGRLLMHEVIRYLEAMNLRGEPVLAGVVENVTEARKWDMWQAWVDRIKALGYEVRVIAMNSMHARPVRTHRAPQSRDRLFVAYWLKSLGRAPDWDKWLRPAAWCPSCGELVAAVQAFKDPRADMGRYGRHGQYVFRCPKASCRHAVVDPEVLPAAAAIDWSDLGTPIGDRKRPMRPATRARIEAGLRKYARPITVEAAGHTFERRPGVRTRPVDHPVTAQTTTATKGLACPPMIVPAGGTWRDGALPVTEPLATRTARENDGLAVPPFLVPLRSGRPRTIDPAAEPVATVVANGSGHALAVPPFVTVLRGGQDAMPVTDPMTTLATSGAHSALAVPDASMITRHFSNDDPGYLSTPAGEPFRTLTAAGHQSLSTWAHLLVPYYGNGYARPVQDPAGTLTSKDRYAFATGSLDIDVDDVLFRMLSPAEIARAMAFADDYVVLGTKKDRIRLLGNAVTPPVAEVIMSALVEAITGEELERAA